MNVLLLILFVSFLIVNWQLGAVLLTSLKMIFYIIIFVIWIILFIVLLMAVEYVVEEFFKKKEK